jgi:hypothetical protein
VQGPWFDPQYHERKNKIPKGEKVHFSPKIEFEFIYPFIMVMALEETDFAHKLHFRFAGKA